MEWRLHISSTSLKLIKRYPESDAIILLFCFSVQSPLHSLPLCVSHASEDVIQSIPAPSGVSMAFNTLPF